MKKKLVIVDLFCGGGGTSTGMMQAAAGMGIDPYSIDLTAVNHWDVALATHAANHPRARHIPTRIEQIRPEDVVPGGRADMLWASPECIEHSVAKGGRPKNDQSRCQAWTVLDWVQRLRPSTVMIENVPEFRNWGPVYADGARVNQPIPSRAGETFSAWVAALESHGYRTGWRVLNCADYGDATTRNRFFLIAKRGNRLPVFPSPTHGQTGDDLFGARQAWRPASEIIDWRIPGHSIFLTREQARAAKLKIQRPLAENTLRRIEAGIRKFWGAWAEPFLIHLRGTRDGQIESSCVRIDHPLPTLTAGGGHVGLVQPFILGQHSGSAPRGAGSPMMTVCTESRGIALCEPFLATVNHGTPDGNHGRRVGSISDPLGTLTTINGLGMISPFLIKYYGAGSGAVAVSDPLDTVTTDDRFGLVRPFVVETPDGTYLADILFRMLTPAELAAAHSFPADYIWTGTKSDVVKQVGNSVPVATAQALCASQIAA